MILSSFSRLAAIAFVFVAIGGASLAASYNSAAVTGQTVTSVNTPTGQFKAQPFRKWVEQGSDGGSFTFDEQNRDAWSVGIPPHRTCEPLSVWGMPSSSRRSA